MTKKIINLGTANKGNGDPLRVAFAKVNDNFDELYTVLGLDSGPLNLGAFEFTGNILSTTDSSNIIIDQAVTINSELTTHGDIVPNIDGEHSLGSATRQWKSLYVSDKTIYINNIPISLDIENRLTINGNPISSTIEYENIPNAPKDIADLTDTTGLLVDLTSVDSITFWDSSVQTTAYRYSASDTAPTITTGALWFNTDEGKLYVNYDNIWVDANPTEIDPSAIRFNDLGQIELPDGGDIVDVNGQSVLSTDRLVNGAYTVSLGSDGNLTLPSGFVTSNEVTGVNLRSGYDVSIISNHMDVDREWIFGSDGTLTLPAGTTYEYFNTPLTGHGDGLARLDFSLVTDGASASWLAASPSPAGSGYSVGNTFTFNATFLGIPGASVTIEVLSIGPGGSIDELGFTIPPLHPADIYRDSPINLQVGATTNRWTFGANGTLTFPFGTLTGAEFGTGFNLTTYGDQARIGASNFVGFETAGGYGQLNMTQDTETNKGRVDIFFQNGPGVLWTFDEADRSLQIPGDIKSEGNINIDINLSDSTLRRWSFGEDGGLTTPGGLQIYDEAGFNGISSKGGLQIDNTGLDQLRIIWNSGGNELPNFAGADVISVGLNAGVTGLDIEIIDETIDSRTWSFRSNGILELPQGAVISETASSPGLLRKKYSGTFVLDPTWFAANAGNLIETSTLTDTIQNVDEPFDPYCFEYTGYFVPPASANYTFKAHADETFIFWIGAKALSGYTYANKDMYGDYNGTFPEQQTQSFTVALAAGQFYPIRIQWGNSGGFGQLDVFTWANDVGQADTANFSGHIYTADTGTAVVSVSDNKSIVLSTDNDTTNNWTFAADGSLTFPDNTVQTTAYTNPNLAFTGYLDYDTVTGDAATFTAVRSSKPLNAIKEIRMNPEIFDIDLNQTSVRAQLEKIVNTPRESKLTLTLASDATKVWNYAVTHIGRTNSNNYYRDYTARFIRTYSDDASGIIRMVIAKGSLSQKYWDPISSSNDWYVGVNNPSSILAFTIADSTAWIRRDYEQLVKFFESVVDNVIYNGATEITDAEQLRTRFYTNADTLISDMGGNLYYNFEAYSTNRYFNSVPLASQTSTVDAEISFRATRFGRYVDESIDNGGAGFQVGQQIVLLGSSLDEYEDSSGDQLDGVHDATVTVVAVDGSGGITEYTVSGYGVGEWGTTSISDGGDDQFDGSNYFSTNVSWTNDHSDGSSIGENNFLQYNSGLVTTGDRANDFFGSGSKYVIAFHKGIVMMAATGVSNSVTWFAITGNSGHDGDGTVDEGDIKIGTRYSLYVRCVNGPEYLPQIDERYLVSLETTDRYGLIEVINDFNNQQSPSDNIILQSLHEGDFTVKSNDELILTANTEVRVRGGNGWVENRDGRDVIIYGGNGFSNGDDTTKFGIGGDITIGSGNGGFYPYDIAAMTNASPAVVTLIRPIELNFTALVKFNFISGLIVSNNVIYYANQISETELEIYTDSALTIPLDTTGSGLFTGGTLWLGKLNGYVDISTLGGVFPGELRLNNFVWPTNNEEASAGQYLRIKSTNGVSPVLEFAGDITADIARNIESENDVSIKVNLTDSTQRIWRFGEDGDLTFPDATVQTTAYAGGNGHMFMIDTNRTDTYVELGTADRPFKTFAAAIAAAEADVATAFTFVLMGCTVSENVNFSGTTFTQITIATSCRSVISGNITIASISTLSQLVVRNIEVGGTFTLTGDGTSEQMNACSFYNVSFSGAVNITATNATAFYEAAFFSTVAFTNISYLYINGAQFNDDWTITANDTGTYPIPSRGIVPGTGGSISIVFGTIANDVNFVKGGTAAYVFQPHMTRMGRSGQTYTLPVGWTMTPHSSVLRGSWVNNGTTAMRNSSSDNAITGTAPSYVGTIGAATVKFNDGTTQTTAYVPADNLVKVSGTWTVTTGTNNYSFEVPINGAYQMWVRANIPNGIISYIATVQVTNTNVAVLGSQRAWNYTDGGSPILLTSMPTQITGAEGTISTTTGSGTTNNVFVFGISNTSGSSQTVYYGYTKIS
jgi:hypothetical protein